ncbi:MAG: preprotein translocase subunit YajC [Clostridium sp.]
MSSTIKILFICLAIMPIFVFIIVNIINGRRMKENIESRKKEIEALKVGIRVMTVSGIYGNIKNIDTEIINLEIAEGIIIEVNKASIAKCIN